MTATDNRTSVRGVRERLDEYLAQSGLGARKVTVVSLTGDASDRKYFRIVPASGESLVFAVHAEPFDYAALPFVQVAALFDAMPVHVPAILGHSGELGILALQDLGDVTLQAHLGAVRADTHVGLYRLAVSLIEIIQRRGAELRSTGAPPYGIAFDVEKLLWELDFFTKHFIEGYRGRALSPAERDALRAEWTSIAEALAAEPRVLCHRDYHSRNLMVSRGDLFVIDFQDARMGPDTYDLVSLLRDSYVDLPEETVEELIRHFVALRREGSPTTHGDSWAHGFRERFELMALQRNLKALGTFGYQTTVRNNPVYMQYIPRTLRYVHSNLARNPRFGRLAELLTGLVDELG